MTEFLNMLDGFNTVSITLRIALAVICGGLIGLERENKRRAAGFRTHILVSIGSAMTPLLGQYLLTLRDMSPDNFVADPVRIAAQVIAGMGFIGAGTIIVTKRRQVKGLTTAAGLWTAAIIGLAAGAGCYVEAILACTLILFSETVFFKLEYYLIAGSRVVNIYVDLADKSELYALISHIKECGVELLDSELGKNPESNSISAIFTLRFPRRANRDEVLRKITAFESIRQVERL